MYRHADIYRPIWRCCRGIVSAKFRRYICSKFCAVALHGAFGNPSCYFVFDPDWLTQIFCLVPSAQRQSLHTYRPLCNSPDKTLYDVTFARRFWCGKQIIACEQTRLCAFVSVGYFTKVSPGLTVFRSACIKKVLIHSEQDPGLHIIRCCTVLHCREVMVLMCCAFFYWWHLSVGTDVYTRSKPTYTQHMFAVCAFCDVELDYCES